MSASTSRFFLFGTSFFRFHRTTPSSPLRFLSSKTELFSYKPLLFRLYCSSSSAAVDTVTGGDTEAITSPINQHPWPEWVTFVDRLKTKGYLVESEGVENEAAAADTETESVYREMNLVKDACLSFARDRYDVFKSLSIDDIQTVVGCGCPNLFRKAVNSAKRLRAYVRLDEGDVCGACNLRGSCDRAYVIVKESEAAARTVDIMRILLFYALDPLVLSGGEKPPGKKLVEASARKLLSELIELSAKSRDPSLQEPAAKAPARKGKAMNFIDDEPSQNIEMKRGDWMCPKCNFMNFARNKQCLKCNEDGPKRVASDDQEMKKGDWICSECNFMNFSRNKRCLKCQAEGPKRVSVDEVEMKKGDWNCRGCGFMNFSSNRECLRCKQPRPSRQLIPGEWECPSCDFLNYRRNMVCRKCNGERPKEATTGYDEQLWRSPY